MTFPLIIWMQVCAHIPTWAKQKTNQKLKQKVEKIMEKRDPMKESNKLINALPPNVKKERTKLRKHWYWPILIDDLLLRSSL